MSYFLNPNPLTSLSTSDILKSVTRFKHHKSLDHKSDGLWLVCSRVSEKASILG